MNSNVLPVRASAGFGLPLGRAAVITGLGYLLMPVAYAEFSLMPRLISSGNPSATLANLKSHPGMLAAAILCYLITFVLDLMIAWSLLILLAPVNRAMSQLAAGFRVVYTLLALVGLMKLVAIQHLLRTPVESNAPGLSAQVQLLVDEFHIDWNFSLILFGIHLVIVGWLIFRCWYIPRLLGIVLIINGLGWMISSLQPIAYPDAHLGFIAITYFGELLFMLWLLIFGWRIKEPQLQPG